MLFYFDHALFKWKNLSLSREEPLVIFALPAKEHFAGTPAILVVCQQRKLRLRWSVGCKEVWTTLDNNVSSKLRTVQIFITLWRERERERERKIGRVAVFNTCGKQNVP